jgi:hypothetical protein
MEEKMFIPAKMKVGYNARQDTYTKKLGFIIYQNSKGIYTSEKSWEGWREKKLGVDEYDNVPLEGFVVNKDVGGTKHSYGWNARQEKIRIYDPRGFEIEITTANLLFILSESNCMRGKGLEGEFIYGWQGKTLTLIPTSCAQYQTSVSYSGKQSNKVSTKELIEGALYETKELQKLVYLGRHNVYGDIKWDHYTDVVPGNCHVFAKPVQDPKMKYDNFHAWPDASKISSVISDTTVENYAELLDKLLKLPQVGKFKQLIKNNANWSYERQYYYNLNTMKGEEYNSRRNSTALIQKADGTLFLETAPNVFQAFSLARERKDVSKKDDYMFKWEHVGYILTSSKKYIYENDELVEKSATNPYKGKHLTKAEINAMPWVKLKIETKNGKHLSIH